jgi:uncharacterized protein
VCQVAADPNPPSDDGLPPLIAALSCTQRRPDVCRIVELLLSYGADPRLRTRIDDMETPFETSVRAGLSKFAELLK